MKVPLSILIITYNEQVNIRYALESVIGWASEIFVVDSYSQDGTVDICREYADKGVQVWQHAFENYSAQRNWALENLPWSNEWVFWIDADERVSPELANELKALFAQGEPEKDFYYVKRRFIFLGGWLKHAAIYPFWIVRLFRHKEGRYFRTVNEQIAISGEPDYLQNDLIHEDRKGLHAWIDKHNRYSSMEAGEYFAIQTGADDAGVGHVKQDLSRPDLQAQILKRIFMRLPFRPLLRFLYMYVWKRGFLDGKPGFIYCMLKAIQQFHISCKLYEMNL